MPCSDNSIPKLTAHTPQTSNLRRLLSKAKLQLLLRERNLPVYGNKTILRQRLEEFGQNPDEWEWCVCVLGRWDTDVWLKGSSNA